MQMKMESPAAAGTANGADYQNWLSLIDHNLNRESSARALAYALADCDPDDRLDILEDAYEFFCAGMPRVLLGTIMEQATFWADRASGAERKAYGLACFNRLSRQEKTAFLAYVQRGQPHE